MRLVLLDRDGILNEDRHDYVKTPDELVMIPGAAQAVARLNRAGYAVAICTNQSSIGRGIVSPETIERIHLRLAQHLAAVGAHVDAIFVCPDPPGPPSRCRKPAPGMLIDALRQFHATPAETPFFGDQLRDLEAATAAGCPRHLIRTGRGPETQAVGLPAAVLPVSVHESLDAAVTAIIAAGG
ncbi:MAG TPA: HAD-IIIA family hydrolase [Alphaproteobacteria bacterium]|nr:HAD-IIIA family hydrolase [Alphaproteobacteria bacterium]